MMVCSCNRLSSEALAEAAVEVAAAPGRGVITPGAVFRTLGCRPQCGGCFPLVIEVIHKATAGLPELAPAPQPHACCGGSCHAAAQSMDGTTIDADLAAAAVVVEIEETVTLVTKDAVVMASVSETLLAAPQRAEDAASQGATIVRLDLYAEKTTPEDRSEDAEQPARRRAV